MRGLGAGTEELNRSQSGPDLAGLVFAMEMHQFMHMIDWSACPEVERIPGKVSGDWIFKNTRVPVKALFENIEGGATVNEFLEWFPGVGRKQVEAVLEHAQRSLEPA